MARKIIASGGSSECKLEAVQLSIHCLLVSSMSTHYRGDCRFLLRRIWQELASFLHWSFTTLYCSLALMSLLSRAEVRSSEDEGTKPLSFYVPHRLSLHPQHPPFSEKQDTATAHRSQLTARCLPFGLLLQPAFDSTEQTVFYTS